MGKSDPHVFHFYEKFIDLKVTYDEVAFFGQPHENSFSEKIKSSKRSFYDLSLENWEINTFPYSAKSKFDLIVCTRCAYFSKNPKKVLESFSKLLKPGGKVLIDWGLGDHWRFEDYKVGWVKNKEHEYAYSNENYLWSTIWDDSFQNHPAYLGFCRAVEEKGYTDVKKAIFEEVPTVIPLEEIDFFDKCNFDILALWPQDPQLYFVFLFEVKK